MSARYSGQPGVQNNAIHRVESRQVQSLFREINEQILTISDSPSAGSELELVCECADPGCFDVLHVPVEIYEEVRRFPARFLVSPGHTGEDDVVVEDGAAFAIVEKTGAAAAAAMRLDPRRRLSALPRPPL